MSGSGYVAVGHLLELVEKTQFLKLVEFKQVLEKLAIQLHSQGSTGLQVCRKNAAQQGEFEKFFSNLAVNVDSTHGYLSTIIKPSDVDDFTFGSIVERTVWNLLKSDIRWKLPKQLKPSQKFADKKEEGICFQIFCLFNRFCDSEHLPMKINDESSKFLLKKFGVETSKRKISFTFQTFLECIYKRKDAFIIVGIKHAYDDYVRDVLIEKKISFRTKTYYTSKLSGRQKVKTGKL